MLTSLISKQKLTTNYGKDLFAAEKEIIAGHSLLEWFFASIGRTVVRYCKLFRNFLQNIHEFRKTIWKTKNVKKKKNTSDGMLYIYRIFFWLEICVKAQIETGVECLLIWISRCSGNNYFIMKLNVGNCFTVQGKAQLNSYNLGVSSCSLY